MIILKGREFTAFLEGDVVIEKVLDTKRMHIESRKCSCTFYVDSDQIIEAETIGWMK